MSDNNKISGSLENYLSKNKLSDVEVVIELNPVNFQTHTSVSQKEKMAIVKEAFNKAIKPLEKIINNKGGNILHSAWINQTIKARIPTQFISDLANENSVATIDLPRSISKE